MDKEKVSVVVPIYKVEKYLHRCIDSILQQTYPNLEVILVNDGSPDNCGVLIEDYKKKDARVISIHQKNGGLSDARNTGMKRVTGDYTMFVDSDDWLDTTMIEKMVKQAKQFSADVVQASFYYAYEDKLLIDTKYGQKVGRAIQLDNPTLMHELVKNEQVKNFAWGKLYKTNIIKDIPFKKGVLFEDVFWAYQVMHKVTKYSILPQPFYYYYQRDDSIVATYTPRNLDILQGLKERHTFLEQFYEELTDESYRQILKTALIHYQLLFMHKHQDRQGIHRNRIKAYIEENYQELKIAARTDKELANQLVLFHLHPYLYFFYQGWLKGLRKLKIVSRKAALEEVNV